MPATVVRRFGVRGFQEVGESPIAASQTFKVRDVLVLNSSGLAAQGATATNRIGAVSGITNCILGVANADAQPSTNDITQLTTKKSATYIKALPGTQFEMPLYSATAANAYPNPNLISAAYECINSTFPSGTGGNTLYAVDLDHTTNKKLIVVDFDDFDYPNWPKVGQDSVPSSGTTSQYCTAWVEFISDQCALTASTLARSA